jgi:hypothetical protein
MGEAIYVRNGMAGGNGGAGSHVHAEIRVQRRFDRHEEPGQYDEGRKRHGCRKVGQPRRDCPCFGTDGKCAHAANRTPPGLEGDGHPPNRSKQRLDAHANGKPFKKGMAGTIFSSVFRI